MSSYRLAVGIPSLNMWHSEFALCLMNLCLHMQKVQVPGYHGNGLKIFNKRTSLLPKSRQGIVEDALTEDCTHLLFVDSDQTFPADLVHRMAKRGLPVIGCNVATKIIPSSPTARLRDPKWPGGKPLFTDPESKGVVEVWRLGCGVMLLNLEVFKTMPKPWFSITWNAAMNDFTGEDWYFCEQLEKAGHKIYVDQDISKEIGHLGQLEFTHDLVGEVIREEVRAQEEAA